MALFERLICSSVPLDFPPPLFYHIVPADTVESTQTETANYTAMSSIEGLSDDIPCLIVQRRRLTVLLILLTTPPILPQIIFLPALSY